MDPRWHAHRIAATGLAQRWHITFKGLRTGPTHSVLAPHAPGHPNLAIEDCPVGPVGTRGATGASSRRPSVIGCCIQPVSENASRS
jgi:hypothetical protein